MQQNQTRGLIELPFSKREIQFVQLLVILLFVGRAFQGFFYDTPIRGLLFDEYWLKGIIEGFSSLDWKTYAQEYANGWVIVLEQCMAVCCLLACFGALCIEKWRTWSRRFLKLGAYITIILAFLSFKEKAYAWGQFFEHATQCSIAFLLIHMTNPQHKNTNKFRTIVAIIVAITFFCHGLYAYGHYPQPHVWIEWCIRVFGMVGITDDTSARVFLVVMGVLDFVAAFYLLLFIFEERIKENATLFKLYYGLMWLMIAYCVAWGTMTALARVVANFYPYRAWEALHEWWFQTSVRIAHGGLPFLLFLLWQKALKKEKTSD